MASAFDTGLEFMRQALELRGYRQQILTADIANASTPGFKALDLDFRQALAAAHGGSQTAATPVSWLTDDPRHMRTGRAEAPDGAASAVQYQANTPVTLDGNSVDLNREKVLAAENAVQYEAAASFSSQMIRMLATAIGGSAAGGGT